MKEQKNKVSKRGNKEIYLRRKKLKDKHDERWGRDPRCSDVLKSIIT